MDIIFIAIECSWRLVTANQLEEAKHFNIKYFPSYHSPLFPFISSNKQPKIESNSPTFEKYWNVLKFYLYILMCKVICIWNVLLFFENIVMRHFDGSSLINDCKFCWDYCEIFAKGKCYSMYNVENLFFTWFSFTNFYLFCH